MKVFDRYRVQIESYDINGYGVCHIEDKVVFVEGAMVSEDVLCEIVNVHKKYAFAATVEIYTKSSNRIEPVCPYAAQCGGCDFLHMEYEVECEIKENKVFQSLKRRTDIKYNPIISSSSIFGYRNKVMVPFGKSSSVICGFYEKKSHKIIPMTSCLISSDLDNEILNTIRNDLNQSNISIYDEQTHTGIFREVMIRHTSLNEYMIVFVVTKPIDLSNLSNHLVSLYPNIKSIYLNINPNQTNVVLSNTYQLLYGNKVITEQILGLYFEVSPSSFMQVNHDQCERLYAEAFRMANLNDSMHVIDAYCGMGSITLNIAKQVKKVYGIEIVESAISNANHNKEINQIYNAEFICGKCEEEIEKLVQKEQIDVIFFDPPRKGCDEKFLDTVIQMKINRIVYISCNIATCARDIAYLEANGYKLQEVTPVDLFSRTAHVESVVLMSRVED